MIHVSIVKLLLNDFFSTVESCHVCGESKKGYLTAKVDELGRAPGGVFTKVMNSLSAPYS